MVSIDPQALRSIADQLSDLRETLIPAGPATTMDTGFAALTAACSDFCRALTAARLAQADCLDQLGNAVRTAAAAWVSADDLPMAR